MSFKAVTWAFEQEIFPSSHKFVLIAVANHCNDNGKSYPGVKTICDLTSQKEKTVRRALQALADSGLITDTGKRAGETSQVKVYQLPSAAWERPPKRGVFKIDEAELEEYVERPPKDSPKTPQRWSNLTSPNTRNQEPGTSNQGGEGNGHDLPEYLGYQSRLCALMGRPINGILRGEEERLLADLIRERPDFESEFVLVSSFKDVCKKDGRRFAESILSLLERWQVLVDRASNYQPAQEPLSVQIKQLQDVIATHIANPESVYHKRNCSDEDKTDLREKRQRLKFLRTQ